MKDVSQMSFLGALENRERILEKHQARNPAFVDTAQPAVLRYLEQHPTATGEEIVDYLKKVGIKPDFCKDDRAFGPIFMSLARRQKIVRVGFCPRRKGHAAPGASIWKLAQVIITSAKVT